MTIKGISFKKDQIEVLDKILEDLFWESKAKSVLLADISGQLISVIGESNVNTLPLSVLAAGNLAATKEMARMIGEPTKFKLLLHEGDTKSVYLSDVGEKLLLLAVFGKDTPIGLVRLSTQTAVSKILDVLEKALENDENQDLYSDASINQNNEELVDALKNSFDELFK